MALALPASKYKIEQFVVGDGRSLAAVLSTSFAGSAVSEVSGLEIISSDIVLVTVPDSEIASVAAAISTRINNPPVVLHTSGALSSDVLSSLSEIGCSVGSIHPLASISTAESGAGRLNGAYFCIEGNPIAVSTADRVAKDLGGIPFTIDTATKALYHASAVIACGHFVALFDTAADLMSRVVGEREKAVAILLPLVGSTFANLRDQDTASALTGTFARTDVGTFASHVEALQDIGDQNIVDIYLDLGLRSLKLALENGADPDRAAEIRRRISLAKGNG